VAFGKVGTLNCAAAAGEGPNSMAIDASGTAWVTYTDGTLFKVSTTNASCTATTFVANQHNFFNFALAFANNGASQTLYVSGVTPQFTGLGLGTIDLGTMALTPIANFGGSLQGQVADLTSTPDGTLYGLFGTAPPVIATIDKAMAATTVVRTLPSTLNLATATDWAFVSGDSGDFWIFSADTSADAAATSQVMHVQSGGAVSVTPSNIGVVVDGASAYSSGCP
jgi:hypothetical protein